MPLRTRAKCVADKARLHKKFNPFELEKKLAGMIPALAEAERNTKTVTVHERKRGSGDNGVGRRVFEVKQL